MHYVNPSNSYCEELWFGSEQGKFDSDLLLLLPDNYIPMEEITSYKIKNKFKMNISKIKIKYNKLKSKFFKEKDIYKMFTDLGFYQEYASLDNAKFNKNIFYKAYKNDNIRTAYLHINKTDCHDLYDVNIKIDYYFQHRQYATEMKNIKIQSKKDIKKILELTYPKYTI